jgi:hypothetical protein
MKPTTGRNRPQYDAVIEIRRSSACTPIDKKHKNRTQAKRQWKKEES